VAARHIPVLIVGGGPVGLALAVELGWRGVACELVEQGDGSIATPKMNEVNTRTMEFCRRWGIADAVLDCPFPADYPLDVAFVTTLSGYELARVPRPPRGSQTPEPHSPHRLQACSQIWFDPILQKLARTFPTVRLRYGRRLESFVQNAAGVTAELVDAATGEREEIAADYLVGCDGGNSVVRRILRIEMIGAGTVSNSASMFFRTPNLLERCGRKPATFFFPIDRHGLWCNVRCIDPRNNLWRLMVDSVGEDATTESIDREKYLSRALGYPLDVEWVGMNVWKRRSMVAERFGKGRVLLAGDAVHQLSPTGALGMNSGVADAVDIGWKLAALLQGWGGEGLIESYDRERRPVGARNVRMATGFYMSMADVREADAAIDDDTEEGARLRRGLAEKLMREIGREFRTIGLQIGYRYDDSPICVPDNSQPPADDPATYVPSARPGARAPHVWLRDGRSILDLFGRGFVLLRFGDADGATLGIAAKRRGVPLAVVDVEEPEAAALYERRLVLVRPDGHVAWRGDALPDNCAAVIDRVRGAV
jgi:2-polyprenyl-6-methoxyphenol hydroxylase-like FAD-dependent oxidoreductase